VTSLQVAYKTKSPADKLWSCILELCYGADAPQIAPVLLSLTNFYSLIFYGLVLTLAHEATIDINSVELVGAACEEFTYQ